MRNALTVEDSSPLWEFDASDEEDSEVMESILSTPSGFIGTIPTPQHLKTKQDCDSDNALEQSTCVVNVFNSTQNAKRNDKNPAHRSTEVVALVKLPSSQHFVLRQPGIGCSAARQSGSV